MVIVLLGIVPPLIIALVGVTTALSRPFAARTTAPLRHGWVVETRQRLIRSREHLADELTPLGAYAAIVAAGTAVIGGLLWPLGWVAFQLGPVDLVMFEWLRARQVPRWTQAMDILTRVGNMPQTKIYVLAGSVIFALVAPRRRWVPPVVILTVFVLEHYLQIALAATVDRGHPPGSLGTWPSGGCARVICVLGILFYLFLHYRRPGHRTAIAGWTVIAILGYVEGYTRAYTLRHWVTDVFGGWLFGVMLLLLGIAAIQAVDRSWRARANSMGSDANGDADGDARRQA